MQAERIGKVACLEWTEIFLVFVVSHLVGDFILQTGWQAENKRGGLGRDPVARRALISHVATYGLAFVPALAWLWGDLGADALGVAALILLPHLVQDDGRLLNVYMREVKRAGEDVQELVVVAVDQSFHVVALLLLAFLAASG
jgi:hypothetical protein